MDIRKAIKSCSKCPLHCNQRPLLDQHKSQAGVFWVGLSAVKVENIEMETPLSTNTNTGKLIFEIEELCGGNYFYKTNLVKCLPLHGDKIRYPNIVEMQSCSHNLDLEISKLKPKVVFLLGKQVSDYISKKYGVRFLDLDENFCYKSYLINKTIFVPMHHPSYILVYKRKMVVKYKREIAKLINSHMSNKYLPKQLSRHSL